MSTLKYVQILNYAKPFEMTSVEETTKVPKERKRSTVIRVSSIKRASDVALHAKRVLRYSPECTLNALGIACQVLADVAALLQKHDIASIASIETNLINSANQKYKGRKTGLLKVVLKRGLKYLSLGEQRTQIASQLFNALGKGGDVVTVSKVLEVVSSSHFEGFRFLKDTKEYLASKAGEDLQLEGFLFVFAMLSDENLTDEEFSSKMDVVIQDSSLV